MTLFEFVAIPVSLIILAVIVTGVWYKKLWVVVIPLVFLLAFGINTQIPNYMGYAIEQKFTDPTEEYIVFKVTSDKSWIYFYVMGQNNHQPRLLKIPNTPENKKKADQIEQQAQKGLTLMKFGKPGPDSEARNGSGDNQDMSPETLKIPDSKSFGKTE